MGLIGSDLENFPGSFLDFSTTVKMVSFPGLYDLFSTMADILWHNITGLLIEFAGGDDSVIMFIGLVFMLLALGMIIGVRRGEAQPEVNISEKWLDIALSGLSLNEITFIIVSVVDFNHKPIM